MQLLQRHNAQQLGCAPCKHTQHAASVKVAPPHFRHSHTQLLPTRHIPASPQLCQAKGFGIEQPKTPQKTAPGSQPVMEDPCPCSSGKAYKNCCQKVHSGAAKAKTPEAALRARFSAYVKGQGDYIKATTHRDFYDFHYSKPISESAPQFDADVQTACSSIEYRDFKVTQTEPGSNELEGFVAFVYKHAGKDKAAQPDAWSVTNQKCRFLKVDDIWQFVDYQTYDYNMSQLAQDVKPEAPRQQA